MSAGNQLLENNEPYVKNNKGTATKLPVVLLGSGATLTVGGAVSFSTSPTGTYFTTTYVGQTTETATDRQIFVAPVACTVVAVTEVHAVAAGGASALQLVHDTGTAAPGTGTDMLTNNTNTGFDLNATAQTPQVGALVTAQTTLAAGDRLSIDFANAVQSTAGLCITVVLKTA